MFAIVFRTAHNSQTVLEAFISNHEVGPLEDVITLAAADLDERLGFEREGDWYIACDGKLWDIAFSESQTEWFLECVDRYTFMNLAEVSFYDNGEEDVQEVVMLDSGRAYAFFLIPFAD